MPIDPRRINVFAYGLDHPEGIAVHRDGSVWAGGEAGQIYRIPPEGKKVEQVGSTGGFILGMGFDPDCTCLMLCDVGRQGLIKFDLKTGKMTPFGQLPAKTPPLRFPNHVAYTHDRRLFVSDSGERDRPTGRILCYEPDGEGAVWHNGPFAFANGLAFSPAGDALFVACSHLPGIERILVAEDGSAGARSEWLRFDQALPDGLAFDQRGNLYVSCYAPSRIYKVAPDRYVVIHADDWKCERLWNPTNIAFGGKKHDQLFIANFGGRHITSIDMLQVGLRLPQFGPPPAVKKPRGIQA
jgi:sugar lactone lactonase YvrE